MRTSCKRGEHCWKAISGGLKCHFCGEIKKEPSWEARDYMKLKNEQLADEYKRREAKADEASKD